MFFVGSKPYVNLVDAVADAFTASFDQDTEVRIETDTGMVEGSFIHGWSLKENPLIDEWLKVNAPDRYTSGVSFKFED